MDFLGLLVCLAAWLALTYMLMSQSMLARSARRALCYFLIGVLAAMLVRGPPMPL